MYNREKLDIASLSLPAEVLAWTAGSDIYESSGESGARTVFINRDGGMYLKIAGRGLLYRASLMQGYFSGIHMSPPVLFYLSADRDYMITRAVDGEDGTSEKYLCEPERLAGLYGRCLRTLHQAGTSGCPVRDALSGQISMAESASYIQSHLDAISDYIGAASAEKAPVEIAAAKGLLVNDVLIHGDYCLPNIILDDWVFKGFIDVADGGIGDRHYDLVWGLWTLCWNLKSQKYGRIFLDAYGRGDIDKDRLRICGLLAAME